MPPGTAPAADRLRRGRVATALLAVALAEVGAAAGFGAASGLSWARLVDLLVVSNVLLGAALALAGWPVARHRPRNPVGWSLLLGGCCYAFTGAGVAVLAWAADTGREGAPWRVLATLVNGLGWSWAVTLFVPAALVLFPDGRLPGRRWRWFVAFLVVDALLLAAVGVLASEGGLPAEVGVPGYFAESALAEADWLETVYGLGIVTGLLGGLTALVLRYGHGDEQVRRQLLWLVLALLVVLAAFTAEGILGTDTLLLGILPLLLIPAAIALAILRHQLLDIRLVMSRSLLYVLLTAAVVAAYALLVTVLDRALRAQVPLDSSVLATLLVALAFNPVRVWLQDRIHRAMYGARDDPVHAMTEVGARLGDASAARGDGLDGALEALCRVLRFPAATLVVDGVEVAGHGTMPPVRYAVPLGTTDEPIGDLVVGLRAGEQRPAPADEQVLRLLAIPLTAAAEAARLADELRVSRERIVSGREEERRRIRRDLHDGLGPVLTGVALEADAALRLLETDRARSAELLAELRDQTTHAIDEVRRVAYDLRPPVLDGMGLLGAVREYAAVLSRPEGGTALTVTVEAPSSLPELPAAVEVAAYRIVTEALTNVLRHSSASLATVRLGVEQHALRLEVVDDGVNIEDGWEPGVGLTSIRERTAELGGASEIRYDRAGGRVRVSLPRTASPAPARTIRTAGADA